MCSIWKHSGEPELSLAEIDKMLKDPLFKTIRVALLTGGEPTLRDDFGDIVRLIVKRCPSLRSVYVTTNGLIPSRAIRAWKDTMEACRAKRIIVGFYVSLDGLNEYHDKVRGFKGAFQRATETILALKELQKKENFILGTETVITRWNIDNLYALEQWLRAHELDCFFSVPAHRSRMFNEDLVFWTNKECLSKYLAFVEHLRKTGKLTYREEFFLNALNNRKRETICPFNMESISVNPNGDLHYCPSLESYGNVRDRPLSEFYYDEQIFKKRKHIQKTKCPYCLQTTAMGHELLIQPLPLLRFYSRKYLRKWLHLD